MEHVAKTTLHADYILYKHTQMDYIRINAAIANGACERLHPCWPRSKERAGHADRPHAAGEGGILYDRASQSDFWEAKRHQRPVLSVS
jgi:hypothetical protein